MTLKVLVCGGRDFADFPGHRAEGAEEPGYAERLARYEREHAVLVRTMDQFCIDRGLFSTESGKKTVGVMPDENWLPYGLHIIAGRARGVDTDVIGWAVGAWVPCTEYPADWKTHGRAAGPIRNQQMLDEGKPDVVIAFPGGRGTADMKQRARDSHIEVIEVAP